MIFNTLVILRHCISRRFFSVLNAARSAELQKGMDDKAVWRWNGTSVHILSSFTNERIICVNIKKKTVPLFPQWKKHWFVLTDQSLRYYKDSIAEEVNFFTQRQIIIGCCSCCCCFHGLLCSQIDFVFSLRRQNWTVRLTSPHATMSKSSRSRGTTASKSWWVSIVAVSDCPPPLITFWKMRLIV